VHMRPTIPTAQSVRQRPYQNKKLVR
jgi:hypothetical protein